MRTLDHWHGMIYDRACNTPFHRISSSKFNNSNYTRIYRKQKHYQQVGFESLKCRR